MNWCACMYMFHGFWQSEIISDFTYKCIYIQRLSSDCLVQHGIKCHTIQILFHSFENWALVIQVYETWTLHQWTIFSHSTLYRITNSESQNVCMANNCSWNRETCRIQHKFGHYPINIALNKIFFGSCSNVDGPVIRNTIQCKTVKIIIMMMNL